jgi:hypothetical protein
VITYRWVEGEDETDFEAVIDAVRDAAADAATS